MPPAHSPLPPAPPPFPSSLPANGSGISKGNGNGKDKDGDTNQNSGGGNSSGHDAKPALPQPAPQLTQTAISSTLPPLPLSFHQHRRHHPPPQQTQLPPQPQPQPPQSTASQPQCPPGDHIASMAGNTQNHSHHGHSGHSSHSPSACTAADIYRRLRLAQMPRSVWTLGDLMCGLPSGWSRGRYHTPTPFPVSLRLQLLASRWFYYPAAVDGADGEGEVGEAVEPYAHGVVRLRFRGHWLYFYDSPREAVFYLLGLDPGYVAVSLRLLTENWAHRRRMRAVPRDVVLSRVWTWIMRYDRYG